MRRLPLHAVYPDGPAPYFTVQALGDPGKLGAQWLAIKGAALDVVIENGGTCHASPRGRARSSGRRAAPAAVRRGAARRQENTRSAGLLNPGVLIDHVFGSISRTRENGSEGGVCVGGVADTRDEAKAAFREAGERGP